MAISSHKTILFVNRVAPPMPGATGRLMVELIGAFQQQGWHANYIAAQKTYARHRILNYLISLLTLTMALFKKRRASVIVLMTDPPFLVWQVFLIRLFSNARVIHWCHDLYPDLLPVMGYRFPRFVLQICNFITQCAMRLCDAIVPIGICMTDILKSKNIDSAKIYPIANWAPLHLQKHNHCTGNRLRILYAGNFGRNHPLQSILETAIYFQSQSERRLEFIFCGSGQQKNWLQSEIADRALNNCSVRDFVADDQLNFMLASGDIHLVTMQDLAAGLLVPCKIYSAAAVGRPCLFLGPAQSEAAHYIARHNAGWVLSAHETATLIAFLQTALNDLQNFKSTVRAELPCSMQLFIALAERLAERLA